jgi:hypothetical protein
MSFLTSSCVVPGQRARAISIKQCPYVATVNSNKVQLTFVEGSLWLSDTQVATNKQVVQAVHKIVENIILTRNKRMRGQVG